MYRNQQKISKLVRPKIKKEIHLKRKPELEPDEVIDKMKKLNYDNEILAEALQKTLVQSSSHQDLHSEQLDEVKTSLEKLRDRVRKVKSKSVAPLGTPR